MHARIRWMVAGIALAAAFVAGPSAIGDEPPRYELKLPAITWKKGDVSTLSARQGAEVIYSPSFGKEDARTKRKESAAWIASVRADEVDRRGVITRGVAFFDSGFVVPQGQQMADQTLGGSRITFGNGRWENAGGLNDPSRDARRYLSDVFMKRAFEEGRIDWLACLAAKDPVAVGDTWKPDYAKLAAHLSKTWDIELDGRGATGECKLDAATEMKLGSKQTVVTIWLQAEFPLRRAPEDARGNRHDVQKDTKLNVTLQAHLGLGVDLPYRQITIGGRYHQRDAKGDGSWRGDLTAWWGLKHEGWIPEPKK